MDTKWKKFSRSAGVKIFLNVGLIICIIVEMIIGACYCERYKEMNSNDCYSYMEGYWQGPSYLYGNHEMQKEVKEKISALMEYILATNVAESEKEKEDCFRKLKTEMKDYQYQISYETEDEKKTVLADDTKDAEDYALYVEYTGYLSGDSYSKDWKNEYTDSLLPQMMKNNPNNAYWDEEEEWDEDSNFYETNDFEWLDVNSLINKLCEGNKEYAEYVADQFMEHLDIYKGNIKNSLRAIYGDTLSGSSNFEEISEATLEKLYGKNASQITQELYDEDMGPDLDGYLYLEDMGLYYSEEDEDYYDPVFDEWFSVSMISNEDAEHYKKAKKYGLYYSASTKDFYNEDLQALFAADSAAADSFIEQLKENANAETDAKDEKEEKEQDSVSLTKAEKQALRNNLVRVLYQGSKLENADMTIQIPISALFGTKDKYSVNVGMKREVYEAKETAYMNKLSQALESWNDFQNIQNEYMGAFVCVLFLLLFFVLGLLCVSGRKSGTDQIVLLGVDYWKTEITLLLLCILVSIAWIAFCEGFVVELQSGALQRDSLQVCWIYLGIIAASAYVCIQLLCSLVRKIKAKIFWSTSLTATLLREGKKVIYKGKEFFYKGKMHRRLLMCAVVVPVFLLLASLFAVDSATCGEPQGMLMILLISGCLWVAVVVFLYRYVQKMDAIWEGIKRVKAGEIQYQIPTTESNHPLNLLAKDINSLSEGLENAVNEMVKSERLKTELLSNVSHDIKTPLTSIITYVDLIKKEDVQPDKVKEYIEVLDQKSQRLKVLTDDLFEAAKASSGAMATEITRIDLGSLICQAAGEYMEKLKKSDLDIRNNVTEGCYEVMADGRLAWRIIENLLGNVSKYALPGSRVYLDAQDEGAFVQVTVKNISSCELNISAEELMERFTRGDQSRNTEGSGLGLNIAKSLAELQGGTFHVEIDGDLFKAVLRLPKAMVTVNTTEKSPVTNVVEG